MRKFVAYPEKRGFSKIDFKKRCKVNVNTLATRACVRKFALITRAWANSSLQGLFKITLPYLTKLALLTRCCDLIYINKCWFMKIGLWKWNFFGVTELFFIIYDFKNGCKNEFKNNNEKSCSWSRYRVSHKIDFKAVLTRNRHVASVGDFLTVKKRRY